MPLAPGPGRKTTFVPLLFFFSSGAAALVYQVVWVRQLLLLAGTTTAAVSTVLAVFMAGLGLGAWIFGGRADRSASPLKLYAYLELGIALYALVLPKLLTASTPVYVEIARGLVGRPWPLLLLRLGLGLLLLIIPTVLMGGTLPLLVRHVGRDSEGVGLDLGTLYTANLAGGVVGSLAAGFVLIRWLGVEGATMVAVLTNLVIGSAALVWSGLAGPSPAAPETASPAGSRLALPAGARPVVWAVVLLSGVLTMAYEVLWTRILVLSFTSTVYAFTLILATFLAGLALGSRLLVVVERRFDPLRALAAAQILGGLASLLCTPLSTRLIGLIDGMADSFGHSGGVFLVAIALSASLVMLIPAGFMGLVLPLGMRLLVDDLARAGRQVGAAYLTNTAGSVVGSLLGGFVLIPLLGLKGTLLCLATVQVALGWAVIVRSRLETRHRVQQLAVSACLLLAAIAGVSSLLRGPSPFDRRVPRGGGPPPRFEAHRDAVGASVSVLMSSVYGKVLRIDGFNAATGEVSAAYMPMMTHIPMLLHPDPRRLLVVCFGTGSTAGAGLLHPGTTIDVVDINPTVFEFAPHFESWNHGVAHDPRARLIVDDGRNFLLTTQGRYDVITSEPMPPYFAGVVNLYSREYYRLAYEHLLPGGLVAQWLPFHLVNAQEAFAILRTVSEVFPETTLWVHDLTGIIVARRDAPIRLDLSRVDGALMPGTLQGDLGRFGVRDRLDFARLYALGPAAIRRATAHTPPITDDRPSLEFHPPRPSERGRRAMRRVSLGPRETPAQEQAGGSETVRWWSLEMSQGLEAVYREGLDEVVPLLGATADEAAAVAQARARDSHSMLGRLYALWGQNGPAVLELEAAARASRDRALRAGFLAEAAAAAVKAGQTGEAGRLIDESLQALPDNSEALALKAALANPTPQSR